MSRPRIVFMGTSTFALPALSFLTTHFDVVAVYTQPPRPRGRGQALQHSPIGVWALGQGLEVRTPPTLKLSQVPEEVDFLTALHPDWIIVAAYGLLLPAWVLDLPSKGCLNIHGSLLPRWRGAAPVAWAIWEGDPVTGVAIMQMEAGLDTGPVFAQASVPIDPDTTSPQLMEILAHKGALLLEEVLENWHQKTPTPQPESGVTYARKLTKQDAWLDWSRPSIMLERQIRALQPWPGASFSWQGEYVAVHAAQAYSTNHNYLPGTVLDKEGAIACGEGILQLKILQRPGRKAMPAQDVLRGMALCPGDILKNTQKDAL